MLVKMWKNENSCTVLGRMWIGAVTIENNMEISQETKNWTTIWSSNLLLSTFPENMKTLIWKDTCTLKFITGLFTIAKICKKPKHHTHTHAHTHTHTHIYTYTMYIYLHNGILLNHKKNEILPFAATWKDLDNIMFNEIN